MGDVFPLPLPKIRAPSVWLVLDGSQHTITVTWNVSAQRRYFNLYDSSAVWIVTKPLIETGPGLEIASIVYEKKLRSMRVTLKKPFWRPQGQIVDYTLEGVDPAWLNGEHRCEVIAPDQFLFYVTGNPSQTLDPGQIALCGAAHRYVDLVKGMMQTSKLIFRDEKFEVF